MGAFVFVECKSQSHALVLKGSGAQPTGPFLFGKEVFKPSNPV